MQYALMILALAVSFWAVAGSNIQRLDNKDGWSFALDSAGVQGGCLEAIGGVPISTHQQLSFYPCADISHPHDYLAQRFFYYQGKIRIVANSSADTQIPFYQKLLPIEYCINFDGLRAEMQVCDPEKSTQQFELMPVYGTEYYLIKNQVYECLTNALGSAVGLPCDKAEPQQWMALREQNAPTTLWMWNSAFAVLSAGLLKKWQGLEYGYRLYIGLIPPWYWTINRLIPGDGDIVHVEVKAPFAFAFALVDIEGQFAGECLKIWFTGNPWQIQIHYGHHKCH